MTISSLEGSLEPIESQAARFSTEQAVDRDIVIVMSWCKSGEYPANKAALINPSEELVLFWLATRNFYLDPAGVLWRRRAQSVEHHQLVVPVSLREDTLE